MPTAPLNGVDIHYEIHGEGPPVVFLNGIMMTVASWRPQIAALRSRYHCVLHDMRGQLKSDKPSEISLEDHVEDLRALLDHLTIDRCHLVGTSYGGEVGLLFALAHPERVQSLAVISAVSEFGPRLRQQTEVWASIARTCPEQLYDVSVPDNYSRPFLEAHPELVEAGRKRLASYPADFFPAFARLVDAFLTLDITKQLPDIVCPTLVLCGSEDTLKPVAYSKLLDERIPETTFLTIPDAGHAVVVERPDAVNTALLGFLARVG